MIYILVAIWLCYIFLYSMSVKKFQKWESPLLGISKYIVILKGKNIEDILEIKKWKYSSLIILVSSVISAMVLWTSYQTNLQIKEGFIKRNLFGQGTKDINITGTFGDKKEITVPLQIEEKYPKDEELNSLYEEYMLQLKKVVLDRNNNFEDINSDLNFIDSLSNYPFQNTWESLNLDVVDNDGLIYSNNFEGNSRRCTVILTVSYLDWIRKEEINMCIKKSNLLDEEMWAKDVIDSLTSVEKETRKDTVVKLPETIRNNEVVWSAKNSSTAIWILLYGIFITALLQFGLHYEIEQKKKERITQLSYEYPQILSKITLYMGAGLSIRRALEQITYDYEEKLKVNGIKKVAYEELRTTILDLENGHSELVAYENWGKRTKVAQYLKLTTLLCQNLKKGSVGLLSLLKLEATNAFEERKIIARRLGEEAGTKLLLPMTIMLVIVMVIIMVPALLSFSMN